MKKILASSICCLSIFVAGTALAAATSVTGPLAVGTSGQATHPEILIQLSNTVHALYTPGTNGISYAISAYHGQGTRTYGSTSNDSKIYYQTLTGDTALYATAPTGTESGSWTSGTWYTL